MSRVTGLCPLWKVILIPVILIIALWEYLCCQVFQFFKRSQKKIWIFKNLKSPSFEILTNNAKLKNIYAGEIEYSCGLNGTAL